MIDGASINGMRLVRTERRLELRLGERHRERPLFVDFERGSLGTRRRSSLSRRQPMARALGLRSGTHSVIDATAGFGGDAFQLACLGCKVLAVERVSIVAELLQDGVARGLQADDGRLRGILARLTVVEADSRALLSALSEDDRPDVVYLDPMYPARTKSALGKKSFRILRDLVGEDPDASELLAAALAAARRRVVVKRLRHAPPLAERPALQVPGTRVRYDVYLTRLIASAAGN